MPSPYLWSPSTRATNPVVVASSTTEWGASGVANNVGILLPTVVENDTSLDMYADFELVVQYGTNPSSGTAIELFFVRSVDGTTFDDASLNNPPASGFGDVFLVRNVTTQQRLIIPQLELPPRSFKIFMRNNTGQTIPATAVLKMYAYRRAVG